MKIYINNEYKCHAAPAEGLREFDLDFFNGKCPAFIEGYRFVPEGESWTRPDGAVFRGEMTAPAEDCRILSAVQRQYERDATERDALTAELADADTALGYVGVVVNE